MTPEQANRLTTDELRGRCPALGPPTPAALDLARVWPLWEEACHAWPGLAMGMSHERCVIVRVVRWDGLGAVERVVVPSGQPAETILRAWLVASADSM